MLPSVPPRRLFLFRQVGDGRWPRAGVGDEDNSPGSTGRDGCPSSVGKRQRRPSMSTDQVLVHKPVEPAQGHSPEHGKLLRFARGSIDEAVITADAAGRVTFLNSLAESLTGWTCPEAMGQPGEAVLRIVNEAN